MADLRAQIISEDKLGLGAMLHDVASVIDFKGTAADLRAWSWRQAGPGCHALDMASVVKPAG